MCYTVGVEEIFLRAKISRGNRIGLVGLFIIFCTFYLYPPSINRAHVNCCQHVPSNILRPLWQWYVFVWRSYNCSSCGTLMHCGEGLKWIKRREECKEEVQSCSSTGPLRSGVKEPFRMSWAYKPTESPVVTCLFVCMWLREMGCSFLTAVIHQLCVRLWPLETEVKKRYVLIDRYFNGWFMTLISNYILFIARFVSTFFPYFYFILQMSYFYY